MWMKYVLKCGAGAVALAAKNHKNNVKNVDNVDN